jgi:hypothetical protein
MPTRFDKLPMLTALALLFCASASTALSQQQPDPSSQQSPSSAPPVQPGQTSKPADEAAPTKSEPPSQPPAAAKPASDDPSQWSSSKKPDTDPDPDADKSAKSRPDAAPGGSKAKPGVLPPETDPAWDPFHAEQDVEVGMFYYHKGDYDAAIGRFEDAIRLRANFAKPRALMAEAYEKKGDKDDAIKYYKEYLQVLPNAADAKKIQSRIDKLSKEK